MSDTLHFQIRGRHTGSEMIMVIAVIDDEELTQERYRLGDGDKRRKVARLWARDDRLRNGVALRGHDIERELEQVENRLRQSLDQGEGGVAAGGGQATILVQMATEGTELFHDSDRDAYATVSVGTHCETYRVMSRDFKRGLSHRFYDIEGKSPNANTMADALCTIEGMAVFDGEQLPVYVRLAEHEGDVYVDLGDPDWTVVRVTRKEWNIVEDAPVKFRRPRGLQALPRPTRGGSLTELRRFVNVGSEDDFILLVGWLIGAYCPRGPHPILITYGEQGSAKTTTCRVLRLLSDPNAAPLRSSPRNERDLIIAASNSRVLGLDNLSRVPEWLSDGLCRISTGAGFGTRALFSDMDETLFSGQRPILLNGIGEIATRPDLLERALQVTLPPIDQSHRRDERGFWADFEAAQAGIFGAILDAVSTALRGLPAVSLGTVPRMADFCRWVVAAEPSLPWPEGEFIPAYASNRDVANDMVLEASPVARVLLEFMEAEVDSWMGTCTDLLDQLNGLASEKLKERKSWPSSPNGLGILLRRIGPCLRERGWSVEFGNEGRGRHKRRLLTIQRMTLAVVPTGPVVPDELLTHADTVSRELVDSTGDDPGEQLSFPATPINSLETGEQGGGDVGDDGANAPHQFAATTPDNETSNDNSASAACRGPRRAARDVEEPEGQPIDDQPIASDDGEEVGL